MQPIIYDNPFGGIDLVIDFENGLEVKIKMDDDTARDMITIIDNKLVARDK